MRVLLCLVLSILISSPALSELRDLRASANGTDGLIWIAFDDPVSRLSTEVTATGLVLTLDGPDLGMRHIIPPRRELVTVLEIAPTATGNVLSLQGAQAWHDVVAELRQGGILIRLRIDPSTQPAALEMSPVAERPQTYTAPAERPTRGPDTGSAPVPTPAVAAASVIASPEPTVPSAEARSAGMADAVTPAAALHGDACTAVAEAVEANPWDDALLLEHAACLGEAGDNGQAARLYEQMLAFEPENVSAILALAELRAQQGDREAARTLYIRAAEHASTDAEAALARHQARALDDQ